MGSCLLVIHTRSKQQHNQRVNADPASDGFFTVFTSFRKHRWVLLRLFAPWLGQVTLGRYSAYEKALQPFRPVGEPIGFSLTAKAIGKAAITAA